LHEVILILYLFIYLLAKLARRYLAIPASQASCERLFSVVRNDVTDKRTSLKADLIEALMFVGQEDIIVLLGYDPFLKLCK